MAKVEHDRENCIGCGACYALFPEGWEMAEDGKSNLIGGEKRESDGWFEKELTSEEDIQKHKAAAEGCPVNVIHLTLNGERVI